MSEQAAISSARLLARLGSGVRPAGAARAEGAGDGGFAGLLERAQRGELRSGRRVSAAARFGIDASMLDALSAAADAAEASGARTLLAIGGTDAIRVNVEGRRVESRDALESGRVSRGAEAVVLIERTEEGGASARAGLPAPGWIANGGLAELLGRAGGAS